MPVCRAVQAGWSAYSGSTRLAFRYKSTVDRAPVATSSWCTCVQGGDDSSCQAQKAKLQSKAAELRQQLQEAQQQAKQSGGQERIASALADLQECQKSCEGEKRSLQEKLSQAESQHHMEESTLAQKLQEATATGQANEGSLREQLRDAQRETADFKESLESVKAQMAKAEASASVRSPCFALCQPHDVVQSALPCSM